MTVHSRLWREACRSLRITGIAVDTTRLSSETMKSAIEVIANVQSVVARVIVVLLSRCDCDWSLSLCAKKEIGLPVIPAAAPSISRSDQGSGRVKASMPIRTVSSAPLEKNAATTSGDSPERRSARSTRLRQAARTASQISGSSQDAQHFNISINLSRSDMTSWYASPIACSASIPCLPGRGVREHLVQMLDRPLRGRQVELLLRPEEPEQVRLRDAGCAGDVLGRGAVEAFRSELRRRRVEHRDAALVGGLSGVVVVIVVSIHSQ